MFVLTACEGYCFVAKADANEWKVGNSDIKGIRASWTRKEDAAPAEEYKT